ncbi:MAG: nuclear transport factor 2 family protein [Bacteroidales bacterium]|nr:nuclear transport factor 2 family protein [Candidatus Cacconaster equi]
MTLEERITRLEDIEAIRSLQAKYQRCLDTRDFNGLSDCFAEDVVSSYGNGRMSYNGREAVLSFLRKAMTLKMPSSHLIHGGEIDVKDVSNASAKWYLEDYLLHRKYKVKLHGAAIYDVDYVKREGCWLIKSIGYKRCYEYVELRGIVNMLTLGKTTFLDALKAKKKSGR